MITQIGRLTRQHPKLTQLTVRRVNDVIDLHGGCPLLALPAVEGRDLWVFGVLASHLEVVLALVQDVEVGGRVRDVEVAHDENALNGFLPEFLVLSEDVIYGFEKDLDAGFLGLLAGMIQVQVNHETLLMDLLILQNGIGQIPRQHTAISRHPRLPGLIKPHKPTINHKELMHEIEYAHLLILLQIPRNAHIPVILLQVLLDEGSLVGLGLLDADDAGEPPEQCLAQLTSTNEVPVICGGPNG
jgi:hypothetical protein